MKMTDYERKLWHKHQCSKCRYWFGTGKMCDYLEIEGKLRKCSIASCEKFVQDPAKKPVRKDLDEYVYKKLHKEPVRTIYKPIPNNMTLRLILKESSISVKHLVRQTGKEVSYWNKMIEYKTALPDEELEKVREIAKEACKYRDMIKKEIEESELQTATIAPATSMCAKTMILLIKWAPTKELYEEIHEGIKQTKKAQQELEDMLQETRIPQQLISKRMGMRPNTLLNIRHKYGASVVTARRAIQAIREIQEERKG